MKQLTILASNKNKNPPVPQKIQELQELLQDFTGFTGFYRNYRIYRSLQELQERGMPAGTFFVLDRCDNHYTMRTYSKSQIII